jgi:CRP/FNR family transcriptional regulator
LLLDEVEDLALTDVETRVGRWLVRRCPDPASSDPARIRLQTTKRLLAAELGTVSETLSRTLAKFRDQDLIVINGKSVTVLCPERLSRFLRTPPAEEEFTGALACQA